MELSRDRFIKLLRIVGLSNAIESVLVESVDLPALWSSNGRYFFSKETRTGNKTIFKIAMPFYIVGDTKVLSTNLK